MTVHGSSCDRQPSKELKKFFFACSPLKPDVKYFRSIEKSTGFVTFLITIILVPYCCLLRVLSNDMLDVSIARVPNMSITKVLWVDRMALKEI